MNKSYAQMTREVDEFCQAKGWRENPVTFGEAMALLHSEVSEALEAYRSWGTADHTEQLYEWGSQPDPDYGHYMPKPEGVGSEFADILIRLLDDCVLFDVELDTEMVKLGSGKFGIPESFGEQMTALHLMISFVVMAWDDAYSMPGDVPQAMAKVYRYLVQLSEHHEINLEAEYNRKMDYNRSRAYRHGGKRL